MVKKKEIPISCWKNTKILIEKHPDIGRHLDFDRKTPRFWFFKKTQILVGKNPDFGRKKPRFGEKTPGSWLKKKKKKKN